MMAYALVAMACGAFSARAAIVDLDAYVMQPILDQNNVALADGSWVAIIGSGDTNIDPMATFGAPTNFIANSTTGDDVILGWVQIDSSLGPGTFATTVQYDSSLINYVYIRFFNTNQHYDQITGMVYWGQSSNTILMGVTLGVSTVDFVDYQTTTNYNNFVVVPEPSTANLLLLVGGMIWAMRASMGRKKKKEASEGDEP